MSDAKKPVQSRFAGRKLAELGLSVDRATKILDAKIAAGQFEWDPFAASVPEKVAAHIGSDPRFGCLVQTPEGDAPRVWFHVRATNEHKTRESFGENVGKGYRHELVATKRGPHGAVSMARIAIIDDDDLAAVEKD